MNKIFKYIKKLFTKWLVVVIGSFLGVIAQVIQIFLDPGFNFDFRSFHAFFYSTLIGFLVSGFLVWQDELKQKQQLEKLQKQKPEYKLRVSKKIYQTKFKKGLNIFKMSVSGLMKKE